MMSFGWRPVMSCYSQYAKGSQDQPSTPSTSGGNPQAPVCPTATWFYVALAAAVFAGLKK